MPLAVPVNDWFPVAIVGKHVPDSNKRKPVWTVVTVTSSGATHPHQRSICSFAFWAEKCDTNALEVLHFG
jgi:hypothetical protein